MRFDLNLMLKSNSYFSSKTGNFYTPTGQNCRPARTATTKNPYKSVAQLWNGDCSPSFSLGFGLQGFGTKTMDNFGYVALSQQRALERQLAVVANNVANSNTAGFKQEKPVFQSAFERVSSNPGQKLKNQLAFVQDYGIAYDRSDGDIIPTGNPLDVAIQGPGYFTVQNKNGETFYTRNGKFRLDAEGAISMISGERVLDQSGQAIIIQSGEHGIQIAGDGTVTTSLGQRGQIALVSFPNGEALINSGNTLLKGDGAQPVNPDKVRLHSGMIENSNVKPIAEMSRMMEIMRAYETTTNMINNYNRMRSQAIDRLSRVQ